MQDCRPKNAEPNPWPRIYTDSHGFTARELFRACRCALSVTLGGLRRRAAWRARGLFGGFAELAQKSAGKNGGEDGAGSLLAHLQAFEESFDVGVGAGGSDGDFGGAKHGEIGIGLVGDDAGVGVAARPRLRREGAGRRRAGENAAGCSWRKLPGRRAWERARTRCRTAGRGARCGRPSRTGWRTGRAGNSGGEEPGRQTAKPGGGSGRRCRG